MAHWSKVSLSKIFMRYVGEEKSYWNQRNQINPIRDFVLPPTDPIAPYFGDVLKEKFGFGSAYLVFRNAEPVAAFKANT